MKFLHSGAVYVIANIVSAAVPFLLLPLLTRALDPKEFGNVVSFSLLVTLCLTVAGLNVHGALGMMWFKDSREEASARNGMALATAALSTALTAMVVATVLWLFPEQSAGITPMMGVVAALTAGSGVILQCRLVLWQSQGKPIQSAVVQIFASILNVGVSLFAVLALNWGSNGRIAGIAGGAIVMALLTVAMFIYAGEVIWMPRRKQVVRLVKFGLPLVLHILAGVALSSADRWIIGLKLDQYTLGLYGAAAQLGAVMAVIADAFVKAYGPWLCARLASTNPQDRYCAVGAVYSAMPAFLVLAMIFGSALYGASSLLLGPQYRSVSEVLPWFMLGGAFSGMYMSTSVMFFFWERTLLLAKITLFTAACSTILTWLLVQEFGIDGAAMGYAMAYALLALTTSVVAYRSFNLPWGEPRKSLIALRHCMAH